MIQLIAKWKGFHLAFLKTNIQSSRDEIFLFFWWNLDFKHFLDVQMNVEEEEIKRLKNWLA